MESNNVSLVRRTSGGGAVFHDLGNCNYAVISPLKDFHRDTFATLISKALISLNIKASVNERHDVIVDGKKISSRFNLVLIFLCTYPDLLINSEEKSH